MITAMAEGGPRAGVKLTAPLSWNGTIVRPWASEEARTREYYPGRYQYSVERDKWVWINLYSVKL